MPRPFVLPDLGEGLSEAEIRAVLVSEGDVIEEDTPLLEVETDKAQVEIPSPMSGRIEKIHVLPGQTVKVGAVLVTFGGEPAPISAAAPPAADPALADSARPAAAPSTGAAAAPHRASPGAAAAPPHGGESAAPPRGPVPATPATRRLARELGVDLRGVSGTGPGGRVTDEDVRAAAAAEQPGPTRDCRQQQANRCKSHYITRRDSVMRPISPAPSRAVLLKQAQGSLCTRTLSSGRQGLLPFWSSSQS